MRKRALTALALLLLASPAAGQQAALKLGDPAPPLPALQWLQGPPLTGFEAGKVSVLEFWAVWCGPCIRGMPHLSDVQERYAKSGVRVVGISRPDANNTRAAAEALVREKKPVMRYTAAWDETGAAYESFMTAAGQRSIPACAVVDGSGRVAWIGHPFFLDLVLPAVLDGSWDLSKSPEKVAALSAEYRSLTQSAALRPRGGEAEELLGRVDAFRAAQPVFGAQLDETRYRLLDDAGRREEAHLQGLALARRWLDSGAATELNELAWSIVNPAAEHAERDLPLALYAATCAAQLGRWKDPYSLDTLARTHWTMGDRARAIEVQKQAIAAAAVEGAASSKLRADLGVRLSEYESAQP